MGMSTHVVGFKPPDDKWKKMKAVWDACSKAGISVPDDVLEFFGHATPDSKGVEVEIEDHECCDEYNARESQGFEINIKKLPPDVTVIRFYNSY